MKTGFDHSLPMVLMRTLDRVMPHFRAIFAEHKITDQQWRVLRVLWQDGTCSLQGLADRTLISAPSLVGVVDRLEQRGLVLRQRHPGNRRQVQITVTEAGQALSLAISPKVDALYQTIMGDVDPGAWRQVQDTLEHIGERANSKD